MSSQSGTAPLTVVFNSEDLIKSKNAHTFIWDFGNGDTLTTTNAITNFTYNNAGTFTAKLKYLKNKQDKIDKAKDGGHVIIVVVPKPNELPVPQLVCHSNIVNNLECNSTGSVDNDGSIVSYKYDWGDSTFTEALNENITNHQYQSAGEKVVRLTVIDDKGASAFIENSYNLKSNTAPVASFICNKTGIQKIHCESNSSDNEEVLSNFKWTLDDGTFYNTSSFDHIFDRPEDVAISNHNVELTVTDSLGLTNSISQNIAIDLQPLLQAPRGYFKVFMDGTKVNLHAFIGRTQFNIKRAYYTVYGTSSTPLQTIVLDEFFANTVSQTDLGAYGNYRIVMTAIDMRDQVYQYAVPFTHTEDTFKLQPHVEFRAVQSAANKVYINLNPSFAFDETAYIKSFTINFGDGNQQELTNDTHISHQYTAPGTYNISVTAKTNHNTQKTLSRAFAVNASSAGLLNPDPTFVYRIFPTSKNVVNFYRKTGSTNGTIVSYLWKFGDGTTSTAENPIHFYNPGTYLVSLTVVDSIGLTNSQFQKITIENFGDDLFSNIACEEDKNLGINCEITALDRLGNIESITVNWGDQSPEVIILNSTLNNGRILKHHLYQRVGSYQVELNVKNTSGTNEKVIQELSVTAPNTLNAQLICTTRNLEVHCDASSSYDSLNLPIQFEFDLGDGTKSFSQSGIIDYKYNTHGAYEIKLKLENTRGVTQVKTQNVFVDISHIFPVAIFSHNSFDNKVGSNFVFDASNSFDLDGSIEKYSWNFGDGNFAEGVTANHPFGDEGKYLVVLTTEDDYGNKSYYSSEINVFKNIPPEVDFTISLNNLYPPVKAIFNGIDFVRDLDGIPLGYTWILDNNEIISTNEPYLEKDILTSGHHFITLEVIDNNGSKTVMEKWFHINPDVVPVASFNIDLITPEEFDVIGFNASNSYDQFGDQLTFEWDFGDGVKETGTVVAHYYEAQGEYDVKLVVKDSQSNFAEYSKVIKVNPYLGKPTAVISINDDIVGVSNGRILGDLIFSGSDSYSKDGEIVNYEWNFGDGETSNETYGSHHYKELGTYNLKLKITNSLGGISLSEKSIIVVEDTYTLDENSTEAINLSGMDERSFNPLLGTLFFKIDGDKKFYSDTSDFSFSTSDERKFALKVIDDKTLMANVVLNDGLNEVELFVRDENGRMIIQRFVLYAGDKSLSLTLNSEDGFAADTELTVILDKDRNITKTIKVNDNESINLSNLPNLRIGLMAKDSRGYFNFKSLIPDGQDVEISLKGFSPPSEISDNTFTNGINGWNIIGGVWQILTKDKGFKVLSIKALEGEDVSLQRTYRSSGEKSFDAHELNSSIIGNSSEYFSVLRNKNTGSLEYTWKSSYYNETNLNEEVDIRNNTVEVKSGDIVELNLKIKNESDAISWFSRVFSAFASGTNVTVIESRSFNTEIKSFDLLSRHYKHSDYSPELIKNEFQNLAYVSLPGRYVTSTNNIYANFELKSSPHKKIKILGMSLKGNDGASAFVEYFGSEIEFNSEGFFSYNNSQNIANLLPQFIISDSIRGVFDQSNELYAEIKILENIDYQYSNDDIENCTNGIVCQKLTTKLKILVDHGITKERYFPNKTIDSRFLNYDNKPYLDKNYINGGDYWVTRELREVLNSLKLSAPSNLDFKIGDVSKVNGGVFSPHTTHNLGVGFDLQTKNMNGNATFSKKSFSDLRLLFKNDLFRKRTKTVGAIPKLSVNLNDYNYAKARCFSGRSGDSFLQLWKDHYHHWHIGIHESTSNYFNKPPMPRQELELASVSEEAEGKYLLNYGFSESPSGAYFYDVVRKDSDHYDDEVLIYDGNSKYSEYDTAILEITESSGKLKIKVDPTSLNIDSYPKYYIRSTTKNPAGQCNEEERQILMAACIEDDTFEVVKIHPNGGGLVSDTSQVGPDVFVGPNVQVCRGTKIFGDNIELSGKALITNNSIINSNVKIFSEKKVIIKNQSTISGKVSLYNSSTIDNSILNNPFDDESKVIESSIENSNLFGLFEVSQSKVVNSKITGPNYKFGNFGANLFGGQMFDSQVSGHILVSGIVSDKAVLSGWSPLSFDGYVALLHIGYGAQVFGAGTYVEGNAYILGQVFGGGHHSMHTDIFQNHFRSSVSAPGAIGTLGHANCLGIVQAGTLNTYMCGQTFTNGKFEFLNLGK